MHAQAKTVRDLTGVQIDPCLQQSNCRSPKEYDLPETFWLDVGKIWIVEGNRRICLNRRINARSRILGGCHSVASFAVRACHHCTSASQVTCECLPTLEKLWPCVAHILLQIKTQPLKPGARMCLDVSSRRVCLGGAILLQKSCRECQDGNETATLI